MVWYPPLDEGRAHAHPHGTRAVPVVAGHLSRFSHVRIQERTQKPVKIQSAVSKASRMCREMPVKSKESVRRVSKKCH
jgi:hypothetical protein